MVAQKYEKILTSQNLKVKKFHFFLIFILSKTRFKNYYYKYRLKR